jgi:O-antigen ligase
VRALRVTAALALVAIVAAGAVATSPQLRRVLERRFALGRQRDESAISLKNVRFRQMAIALSLFRQRPVIGNGPGSFSVLGGLGVHESYYFEQGADLSRIYDPSILTTILNDTGLLGAAAFIALVGAYFAHVRRRGRRLAGRAARNTAWAAHCALVGLFASFIFTQYFWMPFTWLLFALTMVLFESQEEHSSTVLARS